MDLHIYFSIKVYIHPPLDHILIYPSLFRASIGYDHRFSFAMTNFLLLSLYGAFTPAVRNYVSSCRSICSLLDNNSIFLSWCVIAACPTHLESQYFNSPKRGDPLLDSWIIRLYLSWFLPGCQQHGCPYLS